MERKRIESTLLEIHGVKVLRLSKGQSNQVETNVLSNSGIVQVVSTEGERISVRVQSVLDYELYEETPIYVTGYETCRSYLFPSSDGINFAVVISYSKASYATFEQLEDILSAVSNVIFNEGANSQESLKAIRATQEHLKEGSGGQQQQITPTPGGQVSQKSELVSFYDPNLDQSEIGKRDFVDGQQQKSTNLLAQCISGGSSLLGKGISFGANILHKGVQVTGELVQKHVLPERKEGQPDTTVHPHVKQSVRWLKDSSGKVTQVTSYAASKIIGVTVMIGTKAVDSIKSAVDYKPSDSDSVNSKNGSLKFLGEVASASIGGAVEILGAFDEASKKVGMEIGEQSKTIVHRRYGSEVAGVLSDGIGIAANSAAVYSDVKSLSIKGIAAKTTTGTIKAQI